MDTLKVMVASGVTAVVVVALLMVTGAFKSGESLSGVPGVNILPSATTPYTGVINSTSTVTSSTLTASDLDDENVVSMTLTGGSGTLTFPASSSFPGIPNAGDTRVIWVRNASTSASVALTIAGGTGAQLKQAASSTAQVVGDTDGNNGARIEAVRKANTDIVLYMTKYQD